jgi:hypothetical protein
MLVVSTATMSSPIHSIEEKKDLAEIEQIELAVEKDQDIEKEYWLSRADEERALVRKLDRRILPIACLLYLFAC